MVSPPSMVGVDPKGWPCSPRTGQNYTTCAGRGRSGARSTRNRPQTNSDGLHCRKAKSTASECESSVSDPGGPGCGIVTYVVGASSTQL
jgi:hypothetical protein